MEDMYIYTYIYRLNSIEWGKHYSKDNNFPTSCCRGLPQGVCCLNNSVLPYLASLSDISVIYLIHMQREGTVVNGRSTVCHGVNLVLDSIQKVLTFLVFLSNSSLCFSLWFRTSADVFLHCSVVQLV